jgi:hypothetical protein
MPKKYVSHKRINLDTFIEDYFNDLEELYDLLVDIYFRKLVLKRWGISRKEEEELLREIGGQGLVLLFNSMDESVLFKKEGRRIYNIFNEEFEELEKDPEFRKKFYGEEKGIKKITSNG